MKNLQLYANRAMQMLDDINITYGKINAFRVNTRAKKRRGLTIKNKGIRGDDVFDIEIMRALLEDNTPDEGLIDTLLHELLHTCPGCWNHGEHWQQLAQYVNYKYDMNIKRAGTFAELGIAPPEPKYIIQCKKCGRTWKRQRINNFIKYPQLYKCECGGELHRVK